MPSANETRSSPLDDAILENLQNSLNSARVSISASTELLRQAYTHDPSLSTSETLLFRRRLYSEGLMYGCHIYPNSYQLVKAVKATLENYVYLDYEDFRVCLNDIRQQCLKHSSTGYKAQVKHRYVLENLKKLQNDILKSANTLKQAQGQHKQSVQEIKSQGIGALGVGQGALAAAEIAIGATEVIAGVPVAVPMALIALGLGALYYFIGLRRNLAQAEQSLALASTSSTVLKGLLESLGNLLQAVDSIAGFMTVMTNELDELGKTGINEDLAKMHWKIMTRKGRTLVSACNAFIAIEPRIMSDLRSIKDTLESGFESDWMYRLMMFERANDVSAPEARRITEI